MAGEWKGGRGTIPLWGDSKWGVPIHTDFNVLQLITGFGCFFGGDDGPQGAEVTGVGWCKLVLYNKEGGEGIRFSNDY